MAPSTPWAAHVFRLFRKWSAGEGELISTVAVAIDLLCWMRLLLLDGVLAKAEPATLRNRLLHAAARLTKRSRYLIL